MPSADQVPVKSTHSKMRWHMWVVPIAGSTGSALRAVRPPNLHITPGDRRDLRLDAIPGIGPALATALVASVPDPKAFRSGRDFPSRYALRVGEIDVLVVSDG